MVFYPLKFSPIFKQRIWGGTRLTSILNKPSFSEKIGESWELSSLKNNESVVKNGSLTGKNITEIISLHKENIVGNKIYKEFGNHFPLLFKFLDASDNLSIQVHPDNETAKRKHESLGKTEMWYVIDAAPDTKIIAGFNQEITKKDLLNHIHNQTIEEVLSFHETEKGDVFFISEGVVHALGKGAMVAEIQQSSDITYRVYDYNRKETNGKTRELHVEDALECINLDGFKKQHFPDSSKELRRELADCNFFTTNILNTCKPTKISYSGIDSFIVFMCIEGNYKIVCNGAETPVVKGETVLLPAIIKDIEIIPEKDHPLTLLETYIK